MNRRKIAQYPAVAAVLITAALVVGGCASTDAGADAGGSSAGEDASASGIDVAQAEADLDAIVNAPETIDVPAVNGTIPTDQTINVIACALAVCTDVTTGVKDAAAKLGWSVTVVPNDSTPPGYQAAWDQIAQNPGNAVVNTSPILPYSAVSAQTETANVPIVSSTSPDPVGGDLIAVVASEQDIETQGAVEGYWVVADAGAPVKSVYVYDPSIPALASALPGYQDAVQKNCSACSVDVLEVSAAQIGPALAQQVVSYLQSNPDTKYVAFGLGDLATGVPAAIKASGVQGVKLTTRAATPTNLADVENGGMEVAFTAELFESGWRAVDKLARGLSGDQIGDEYPIGIIRQIGKDNLPSDISVSYSVPDFQAPFEAAWGLQ